MTLLMLLFAHFLADFPLQGEWLAREKGKEPLFMIAHIAIWTGCVCIALHFAGLLCGWKIAFLFFGHWFLDVFKCHALTPRAEREYMTRFKPGLAFLLEIHGVEESQAILHRRKWYMYVDQLLHLVQLLIVAFL